jgi:hypothetical protein
MIGSSSTSATENSGVMLLCNRYAKMMMYRKWCDQPSSYVTSEP